MQSRQDGWMQRFLAMESAGGILLMVATVLALLVANSPLSALYGKLLDTLVVVGAGSFRIEKPLLLWINDGLMAVFFFLVGLELKRELVEGELSDPRQILLPAIGAVGGMAVPALFYVALNQGDPVALKGWAIPAATDIAFALGVLSLLGPRVPLSLKVFLTSLAIFDDVGAILIIAFFYTSKISITALAVAGASLIVLWILNRRHVEARSVYILVGLVLWTALLKSGVHATLAGVMLAFFIPIRSRDPEAPSPLKSLEHDLHHAVAFLILPVFAFANTGLDLRGMQAEGLLHGVPVGVAAGLFLGKPIGIFGLCYLALKLGWVRLPQGMNPGTLLGVSGLCGIGFTMSLFIGSLAFEETGVNLLFDERLGILAGSLLSGLLGYFVLKRTLPQAA